MKEIKFKKAIIWKDKSITYQTNKGTIKTINTKIKTQ